MVRILCGLVATTVMVCPMLYGQAAPEPVDAIFESQVIKPWFRICIVKPRKKALTTSGAAKP